MARDGLVLVQRRGRPSRLDDEETREHAIRLASTGASRVGVCARIGVGKGYLQTWLDRGAAQPDTVFGEFARQYIAAERAGELIGTEIIAQHLARIARKKPGKRSEADIEFVMRHTARRYPREHGAGEGLVQLRQLEAESDPQKWWIEHGLAIEQLRALLRDPPEQVKEALVLEGDAVFALLLASGWSPRQVT